MYFPSKEQLLKAAIASPALEALAEVRPGAERDGNSTDALRRVLSDVWGHLQDETVGSVLKLAISEARRFPEIMEVWLCGVVRPVRSLIVDAVLQGMDRGEFRKLDPDVVAHSLLLPMFMLCLQRHAIDTGAPRTDVWTKVSFRSTSTLCFRDFVVIHRQSAEAKLGRTVGAALFVSP